jgi:hypothetical protein
MVPFFCFQELAETAALAGVSASGNWKWQNKRGTQEDQPEKSILSVIIILPFPFLFLQRLPGRESFQNLVTGISGSGKDQCY